MLNYASGRVYAQDQRPHGSMREQRSDFCTIPEFDSPLRVTSIVRICRRRYFLGLTSRVLECRDSQAGAVTAAGRRRVPCATLAARPVRPGTVAEEGPWRSVPG